ncbi:MAG TPA: 1-(5-phosphoribosyl)-5-[(5-phosphoribosylamino)methylideneamino] imidazole-4-carboxamide isomerase [Bacillota bacterium]
MNDVASNNFEVLAAVDILGGRCVRLWQGDYAAATDYGDPLELARRWRAQGWEWLHLVDLEGARSGHPVALDLAARIRRETGCKVQYGGGLRDAERVQRALECADRVIVSSWALRDPEGVERVCRNWPGRILVSLDVRDGRLWGDGWHTPLAADPAAWARRFAEAGAKGVVVTNIAADGTLAGVAATAVRSVASWQVPFWWAGGIATAEDVVRVCSEGSPHARGAIVGRALYEGTVNLDGIRRALMAAQPGPAATAGGAGGDGSC